MDHCFCIWIIVFFFVLQKPCIVFMDYCFFTNYCFFSWIICLRYGLLFFFLLDYCFFFCFMDYWFVAGLLVPLWILVFLLDYCFYCWSIVFCWIIGCLLDYLCSLLDSWLCWRIIVFFCFMDHLFFLWIIGFVAGLLVSRLFICCFLLAGLLFVLLELFFVAYNVLGF